MKFTKPKLAEQVQEERNQISKRLPFYRLILAVHAAVSGLGISLLALLPQIQSSQQSWMISASFFSLLALISFDAFYFRYLQKQNEKRLEMDPTWDELTGTWNAMYLETHLQDELMRAGRYRYPVTLCTIDLERFKSFNENFGPRRGDELLKRFCLLVQSNIRATDILARDEKDVFYLLLPHTDMIRSERVVQRLLEQTQENLDIYFRAGITSFRTGENPAQFQERSRAALLQTKRHGNKRVQCFISDGESYATVEF